MSYTAFDATKPDAATQNGTQFAQSTRDNLAAVRDACVLGGGFPGWALAVSGGTAEQPATLTYSKGTERVRAVLTWGTTGGASGNVTQAVYAYSADSGTNYDTIGTKTITYDASGNVTATAWA